MQLKERNRFRPRMESLECRDVPTAGSGLGSTLAAQANAMVPNVTVVVPSVTVVPVVQLNIAVLGTNITQVNIGSVHA
jgi:hypothetical protein